jgi:hypothetical protein
MAKHEAGYARVERDFYPTPPGVVSDALAEHVDLRGLIVCEPACGDGRMAEALRLQGCARVYTSDIVDRGTGEDEVLDFLSAQMPNLERPPDAIITNPPFGQGGKRATAFIEVGLKRLSPGRLLALLLPCDFDSAKTRARYFGDCPDSIAKIVLRKRIVWFQRDDGIYAAPKENHAWFLWQRSLLRTHRPFILYAPETEPLPKTPGAERADEALRQLEMLRGQTPSNRGGQVSGTSVLQTTRARSSILPRSTNSPPGSYRTEPEASQHPQRVPGRSS